MATFSALTSEQKDIYNTFERDLRGLCGEMQRLFNRLDSLNQRYTSQMQGILVALDDNSIVPNTSGLAGSSSLDSDAEMATLVSHIQGILTNYNTQGHKEMRAKAAGAANTAN